MIEQPRKGFRLMPASCMEALKGVVVKIGHERCASSSFSDSGTLIICALHSYGIAQSVLCAGRYYFGCRDCIDAECPKAFANTEAKARGLYVDLGGET